MASQGVVNGAIDNHEEKILPGARQANVIQEGDTVIVHVGFRQAHAIVAKRKETFQHKYGCLRHDDIIGKPYGSTVQCPRGFVRVLRFSCEWWTRTLRHRTQILYSKDIGVIVFQLDLSGESVVCEAGLGSGSLSHGILRAIAPGGKLHTHDLNGERLGAAREEFDRHGFGSNVVLEKRDVCVEGFGVENAADAVFLDLPTPWLALEGVKRSMKQGSLCRFGSFSPCIEQVQKTCKGLRKLGFCEIVCITVGQQSFRLGKVTAKRWSATGQSDSAKDYEPITHRSLTPHPNKQHSFSGYLVFASKLPDISSLSDQ